MTLTGYEIKRRQTTAALIAGNKGEPAMMIKLPWPPLILSPNARPFWAEKARAVKAYKAACVALLTSAKHSNGWSLVGRTKFRISFAPPTRRRMDIDNAIARFKPGLDALALVTHMDDSEFEIEWPRKFLEPVMDGAVLLEVLY